MDPYEKDPKEKDRGIHNNFDRGIHNNFDKHLQEKATDFTHQNIGYIIN
jgi:hypothetical protein